MRGIEELGNREIIWNIERSCSDRRGHGGSDGTLCVWARLLMRSASDTSAQMSPTDAASIHSTI